MQHMVLQREGSTAAKGVGQNFDLEQEQSPTEKAPVAGADGCHVDCTHSAEVRNVQQ